MRQAKATSRVYPHRNKDVQTTLLANGHLIIFDSLSSWAHTVNPGGALVWELSDGKHDVGEIAVKVAETGFQMSESAVGQFLQELSEAGLLHFADYPCCSCWEDTLTKGKI